MALLSVGEDHPSRDYIQRELGEFRPAEALGHDGKYAYLVARDPFARGAGVPLTDDPPYRYRRILLPLLGGWFGLASPVQTLFGLVAINAISVGVAGAALVFIIDCLRGRRWAFVAAFANVGILSSLALTTPDALAIGLSLATVALVLHDRLRTAAVVMLLAVLAKEVYVLIAVGLATYLWLRRCWRAAAMLGVPTIVGLGAWFGVVRLWLGPTRTHELIIGAPFVGIVHDIQSGIGGAGGGLTALLIAVTAAVLVWSSRRALLVCLAAPWLALVIVGTQLAWLRDAPRIVAPLMTFAILGAAVLVAGRPATWDHRGGQQFAASAPPEHGSRV